MPNFGNMKKAIKSTDFHFPGQTNRYGGKVRDVYTVGDKLVMIASDRISAFDVILPEPIPYKGQVLNQIAAKFLDSTKYIVPNWVEVIPDPNVTIGKACKPFPVEMVIRGYLAGHAAREYKAGKRMLCGVSLPEGLKEIAAEQGLILVDTKYEFGLFEGKVILIDEVHTPDSSRYFYQNTYQELQDSNSPQRQLSKEFVRQWLISQGFQGKEGQKVPVMDEAMVNSISERYIELYEKITGEAFVKESAEDVHKRMEQNILNALG